MALTYMNDITPESLIDMPGDVKIAEDKDYRMQSASDFTLQKEDHTVANMLRMKLHESSLVKFAGYRVPHPTEHKVVLKVQTAPDGSGAAIPTPSGAVTRAIEGCVEDLNYFEKQYRKALVDFGGFPLAEDE